MNTLLPLIASTVPPTPTVPDSGATGILLGLGLLSVGIIARVIKNRKR